MEWLFNHTDDPDLNTPLYIERPKPVDTAALVENFDPDHIMMLTSMGFTEPQAKIALKKTNNNIERAADWIFSHLDEIQTELDSEAAQPKRKNFPYTTGSSDYVLRAFVSHMGQNTCSGHYVCHVKPDIKEDKWIIFNDEKACHSIEPPRNHGYLYFFERK